MTEPQDQAEQHFQQQEKEYAEYQVEEQRKAHEQEQLLASICPLCGDFTGGGYCSICIRELM